MPQQNLNVNDAPAQTMRLDEGANVEELVNGLHAIGTTARDVVAILAGHPGRRRNAGRSGGAVNGNGNFSRSAGSAGADAAYLQPARTALLQQIQSAAGSGDDAKIEKGAKEFEAMLLGSWLQQAEQSLATVPGADDDEDAAGRDQMMSLGVQSLANAGGIRGHRNRQNDRQGPACMPQIRNLQRPIPAVTGKKAPQITK